MERAVEVFVNGHFRPASQATVSVQDRGLLYGDGLFETLRAEGGGLSGWETICRGWPNPQR